MKTQIKHELRLYIEKSCQDLQILKKHALFFQNSLFYYYRQTHKLTYIKKK